MNPGRVPDPLSPEELLRRVRRLELTSRKPVGESLAGAYRSVFRGQGVEFLEVRPYQRGDDVRTIDWNVTARTGELHVRRYREERERTVWFLVDASGSVGFGSGGRTKSELAAELVAALGFSALRNHDRIGLLIFSDRREKIIPPRKGKAQMMRLLAEILQHPPASRGTHVACALEFLGRIRNRHSLVFLLSDFLAPDFTPALAIAKKKHDCVALILNDRREYFLPSLGWIRLQDSETGQVTEVNTGSPQGRREYEEFARARARARRQYFAAQEVDALDFFTDLPWAATLRRFFQERQGRRR